MYIKLTEVEAKEIEGMYGTSDELQPIQISETEWIIPEDCFQKAVFKTKRNEEIIKQKTRISLAVAKEDVRIFEETTRVKR
jgi:hypothetical protein